MGTNIQSFIEIDYCQEPISFSVPEQIFSLTEGPFILDREYELFDALAGGRNSFMDTHDRDPSREPLISPRGVPTPCSLTIAQHYYSLIADAKCLPNEHFWPSDRCVPQDVAAEWIKSSSSVQATVHQWFNCNSNGQTWSVVSNPGLRAASWLTLDEFDKSLELQRILLKDCDATFRVFRSTFAAAVDEFGTNRVRIVVWFK